MRRVQFILPSDSGHEVFLVRTERGWALPEYPEPVSDRVAFDDAAPFNEWFQRHCGFVAFRSNAIEPADSDVTFFVLESRSPDTDPLLNGSWVRWRDLDDAAFASSAYRDALDGWFEGRDGHRTIPWAARGVIDGAIAWMFDRLAELGLHPTGPVAQVKSAYVSCVLRCDTREGGVYLKMLPDVFVSELAVTQMLHAWEIVPLPKILAVDPNRRWLLMRDMGGRDLTEVADLEVWKTVMQHLALFQRASLHFLGDRSAEALADWRPCKMRDAVDALVEETPALLLGSPHALTAAELDALRASAPRWKTQCDRIAEYPVPCTIEHGDLRAGNIRITPTEIIFYDWAWSAIAHPFLSASGLLNIHRAWLGTIPGAAEHLRDAYLDAWTDYAPLHRLQELFGLVASWMPLYGALGDAGWLRAIGEALGGQPPACGSADGWTLLRRQYYFAKIVRRLFP